MLIWHRQALLQSGDRGLQHFDDGLGFAERQQREFPTFLSALLQLATAFETAHSSVSTANLPGATPVNVFKADSSSAAGTTRYS